MQNFKSTPFVVQKKIIFIAMLSIFAPGLLGCIFTAPTQSLQIPVGEEIAPTPTSPQAPENLNEDFGGAGFDGERALGYVETQLSFGPRIPGTAGHAAILEWMQATLTQLGWQTEIQDEFVMEQPIKNLVASRGQGSPWIILGAHYDTRIYADQDPDPEKRQLPVPGANDGASGVAILLELAGAIPADFPGEIWLVFFDAEDNGKIPGWDWVLGSRLFVDRLDGKPDAVVVVDMVGDANQNIFFEKNSDAILNRQIWDVAASLGYADRLISTPKFSMLDDHTAFLRAGIPAVDIIDFDYPYWHTTEDTLDKVSAQSLQAVGDTLLAWLKPNHLP